MDSHVQRICQLCTRAEAKVLCGCKQLYLCTGCVVAHLPSPGSHNVQPIAVPQPVLPVQPNLPEFEALGMFKNGPSIQNTIPSTGNPVIAKVGIQPVNISPIKPPILNPPNPVNAMAQPAQKLSSKKPKKTEAWKKLQEEKKKNAAQRSGSRPVSPPKILVPGQEVMHSEPVSPTNVKSVHLAEHVIEAPKFEHPCYACEKAEATVVLTCYEQPQMCCGPCAGEYRTLPLCVFPHLTDNDVIDFANMKYEYATETKKKLDANISALEKFKEQAEKKLTQAIKDLEACKKRILDKLDFIKSDFQSKFNSAFAEVEKNLHNTDYRPKNDFSLVLWEPRVEDANFELFKHRLGNPEVVGEVTRAIDYEVRGIIALNCVPVITATDVRKFNCKREKWSPPIPLDKPVHVSKNTVFVYLNGQEVMCCGNYDEEGEVFSAEIAKVNIATGVVEFLPPMETPRYHQGGICVGRNVYMFGGKNPDYLNSCEKFALDHGKWCTVKEMLTPRACFNPLLHEKLIYILGGQNTLDSEIYDFMRNNFLPLCLRLPKDAGVSTFALDYEIIVLQEDKCLLWNPMHKSIKYVTKKREVDIGLVEEQPEMAWSNFTPLYVNGYLYLLTNERREIARQELGGRFDIHVFEFEHRDDL